ncbi:MAG: glycosyltransferase family 4 protein [Verrucomicrobiota bacterium]
MARVVLLGSYAPSLVNFRGKLIEDLVEKGHEVFGCASGEDVAVSDQLESWGARYIPLQLERTGLNPAADLRTLKDLIKQFREIRPDAIFAYTIKPVVYGSIAARLAGVPQMFSMITGLGYAFMGSTAKQRLVGGIAKLMYRTALTFNEKVFFQNEDDARLFSDLGLMNAERAVLTGGSGVDLEHYELAPIPEEPIRFLMCARILVEKGVREYFEAAKLVHQQFPEAEFSYVGPFDVGNPSAIDEEALDAMNPDNLVRLHGGTDDVRPFFRDCSVYVLPSYREGTPRTVLEAAAMGRPVITTNSPGGCPQTIRDGKSGKLIPVQDSNALAAAMTWFLDNPAEIPKMGEAGRHYMAQRFDVKVVNRTILDTMGL